jgi:small subunit ribosomal protein S8
LIEGIKRVSTPGRRVYVGAGRVPQVRAGFGTAIISTSKGLMTDEQARQQKVGGEVVCYIW